MESRALRWPPARGATLGTPIPAELTNEHPTLWGVPPMTPAAPMICARGRRLHWHEGIVLLCIALWPPATGAQSAGLGVGVAGLAVIPVTSWARVRNANAGGAASLRFASPRLGPLALRAELTGVPTGAKTTMVTVPGLGPFPGGIPGHLTNRSGVVALGFGPELSAELGAVHVYAIAAAGVAWVRASSVAAGSGGGEGSFSDHLASHPTNFAWSGGGGVVVPVGRGRWPVALDLGARYQDAGNAVYFVPPPRTLQDLVPAKRRTTFLAPRLGIDVKY
jgi:hypothetical protein